MKSFERIFPNKFYWGQEELEYFGGQRTREKLLHIWKFWTICVSRGKISGVFIMEPLTVQARSTNPPEKWFYLFGVGSFFRWTNNTTTPKEGFDKFFQLWVVKKAVESTKTKKIVRACHGNFGYCEQGIRWHKKSRPLACPSSVRCKSRNSWISQPLHCGDSLQHAQRRVPEKRYPRK